MKRHVSNCLIMEIQIILEKLRKQRVFAVFAVEKKLVSQREPLQEPFIVNCGDAQLNKYKQT